MLRTDGHSVGNGTGMLYDSREQPETILERRAVQTAAVRAVLLIQRTVRAVCSTNCSAHCSTPFDTVEFALYTARAIDQLDA